MVVGLEKGSVLALVLQSHCCASFCDKDTSQNKPLMLSVFSSDPGDQNQNNLALNPGFLA